MHTHTELKKKKKRIQERKRITSTLMGTLICEKMLNRLGLPSFGKKLLEGEDKRDL